MNGKKIIVTLVAAGILVVAILLVMHRRQQSKPAVPDTPAVTEQRQEPAVPAEQEKEKTVQEYVEIETSYDGWILRNGDKLYRSRGKGEAPALFLEKNGGQTVRLTNFDDSVDRYVVSPGETWAAVQVAKGGNEQYGIYVVNILAGAFITSPELNDPAVRHEQVTWCSDNTFFYVSNEVNKKDFFIYRYSIPTNEKKLISDKPGMNILTDAPTCDQLFFYTFKGNNITTPYMYENGRVSKLAGTVPDRYYEPVGLMRDGRILMITNQGSDEQYLELRDKEGKAEQVYRGKWGVEQAVIDRSSRDQAVFCANEDGYSACYLYKNSQLTLLPLPVGTISLSQLDGLTLGYTPNLPDAITQPAAFNISTHKNTVFGYIDARGIRVSDFVKPQVRRVTSFDGVEVPYFIYIPKTAKPPYPTIVYYHGGPEGQFRPRFISTFQYYLKKGFMIVAPNVRGSTGYGQTYMDMDNYTKRMDTLKDGQAILDQLINDGLAAKGGFIAMGGSYGGFMSVASMAVLADYFGCGIDTVGVVDFVNFLENTKAYRQKLREVEYGPLSDKKFLKSISPANMTGSIKGKLFIAHGANDPRVPVSDAYILIENLKKAGNPPEVLIFEDEGHGFRKKSNQLEYYTKSAAFIEQCAQTKPAAR